MGASGRSEEEQLDYVEEEEEALKARLEHTSRVLELAAKRQALLDQRAEMDTAANDPSRLLAKGRGAASRLLQEEKLRKAVARDLPRMNAKLLELVEAWHEERRAAGKPEERLSFQGVCIKEMIKMQEHADGEAGRLKAAEKEQGRARRQEKKAAKTAGKRGPSQEHVITPRPGATTSKGTKPAAKPGVRPSQPGAKPAPPAAAAPAPSSPRPPPPPN